MTRIALDASGGDQVPDAPVGGALQAAENHLSQDIGDELAHGAVA